MARDLLRTRACDLFSIDVPIFAFSHCRDVVVEVSKAGGMGVYGTTHVIDVDDLDRDIAWIRERVGGKPFGIDVAIPATAPVEGTEAEIVAQIPAEYWRFVDEFVATHRIPRPKGHTPGNYWRGWFSQETYRRQLEVVLEHRVPLLASALGSPAFILEEAHARGVKVAGLVGRVRQARRELDAGVDAIIAQGGDAAGHTGPIGTFSLVPRVAAIAGDTPVIAAGGVTTGRHIVAALALGAVGVWTGTLWVASRESDDDIIVKRNLVKATEDDAVLSTSWTGKPVRRLRTPWTDAWAAPTSPRTLPAPYQWRLGADYRQAVEDYRIEDHLGGIAGQGVGFVTEIKPARQIMLDLVTEAQGVFEELTAAAEAVAP